MKLFNVLVIISLICVNFISCTLTTGPQNDKLEGFIVFSAREKPESNSQLYTMNADGSEIRQLTFFENTNAYNPRWSPDGEQIVFTSYGRSVSQEEVGIWFFHLPDSFYKRFGYGA